jgi:hypothetical protein
MGSVALQSRLGPIDKPQRDRAHTPNNLTQSSIYARLTAREHHPYTAVNARWKGTPMPRENRLLAAGDPAPAFTVPDAGGTAHSPIAAGGAGSKVALFFFRGIW